MSDWKLKGDTWLLGTQVSGAGVFQQDGGWYYNVVHPEISSVQGNLNPIKTKEEAEKTAEDILQELEGL